VGKLIDIALPQGGIIITLLRFIQFGILTSNEFLDLNMSIYRIGLHLHFVLEKENRCREIE